MNQAPDPSSFGSDLPDLEDLLPEDIRYLRAVCRWLRELGLGGAAHPDEHFDADELGLDPELDAGD